LEAAKKATKMAWPLDEGRILVIIGVLLLPITNFAQNPSQLPNAAVAGSQNQISRRFEYKYSFKPPYLAQKDGTVPFFEYSGNAIASEESVRITPSLRSQKGMIWSRLITSFDWWEVELQFRVTGRGRIGADGLAFWYTSTKGFEGPVFGSSDKWNGLGVFFDSFDNDNKHNNPYIMGMVNDGTKAYDHQKDGSTQQLAGCLRDFRNKPFPVRAKIEFFKNTLTVMFHNGMSNNDKEYEVCMRAENVVLPQNGYFGISAATGGLADDHDVLKFSVTSLRSLDEAKNLAVDPEFQKNQDEFDEYEKKLKTQKDQWKKDNPEEAKKKEQESEQDWDNWFSEQDKELQQIFQGQSAMREVLTDLHRKMDEIITRQERTLTLVQQGKPAGGGGGGQPQIGVDTIRRDEVNAVLANQKEIVGASRDIKNLVSDIHGKTGQLLSRGQGTAQQVAGGSYEDQKALREIKDQINNLKREFSQTAQQIASTPCQSAGGCVSTTVLVALLGVQLLILISFMMYRDGKEKAAKKYY
jgi:mannose-binding lectin 1